MKFFYVLLSLAFLILSSAENGYSRETEPRRGQRAAPVREPVQEADDNPLFGYTHLLPSPFTLPAGRLAIGTAVAYGVTDFFQLGTSLIHDFYKIYNLNAKLSFLSIPSVAIATYVSYETYNFKDISRANPDLSVTTWKPGAVLGTAMDHDVAIFYGGNLNLADKDFKKSGLINSGYVQGATLQSDVSWSYESSPRRVGNVLSTGVTYDTTYQVFGAGISHHWPGFHLGIHYFLNAKENRLLPIAAGGATMDL